MEAIRIRKEKLSWLKKIDVLIVAPTCLQMLPVAFVHDV
jgi:hypothetical protein